MPFRALGPVSIRCCEYNGRRRRRRRVAHVHPQRSHARGTQLVRLKLRHVTLASDQRVRLFPSPSDYPRRGGGNSSAKIRSMNITIIL